MAGTIGDESPLQTEIEGEAGLRRRLWVVIPAYNEETTIAGVLAELRRHWPNVVVVDDGSRDQTAEAARRAGAVVVRHPVNLGQGAGLQTGIRYALSQGAEYIATFDADGQHDARDIRRIVQAMEEAGAEIGLGSRFLGTAVGMTRKRRLTLQLAVLFTRLTSGLTLTDAHNGLRVFTAPAAAKLRITQNRMAHASEILDQIARLRLSYVEVPVTIYYTDYSKAKGQSGLDALTILLDLFEGRLYR